MDTSAVITNAIFIALCVKKKKKKKCSQKAIHLKKNEAFSILTTRTRWSSRRCIVYVQAHIFGSLPIQFCLFCKNSLSTSLQLPSKMFGLHSIAIKSAMCGCSWKEGVIWGPTVTHWEMSGETTLRVISPVYLGGPVLNHGCLANAIHSHSHRPQPHACWVDRQQSKRTDLCSVYHGCVTAISPVQPVKTTFLTRLLGKKCNNLNMSGDTPSTFTAAILFMRFRIQYIVLLHMTLGVN